MLGGTGGRRRRRRQRMRWLDGITDSMDEFAWTPGVGDGQGGLVCCNSWSRKESDMTERLNGTELIPKWINDVFLPRKIVKNYILAHKINAIPRKPNCPCNWNESFKDWIFLKCAPDFVVSNSKYYNTAFLAFLNRLYWRKINLILTIQGYVLILFIFIYNVYVS